MRAVALLALSLAAACLLAPAARAAPMNLATMSCDKYENQIAGASSLDPIDTVMWLFGFSVAQAGDHMMYGDALTSFGFALDAECKNHPSSSLLQAVSSIRPKRDKPMDLTALNCEAFESRHAESVRSDPDSARTIMMWLFGFSSGRAGNHVLDPDGVAGFAAALQARCTQNPNDSLFEALSAIHTPGRR